MSDRRVLCIPVYPRRVELLESIDVANEGVGHIEFILDPDKAIDDVQSAINDHYRERYYGPGALVLGVRTYWSLCRAMDRGLDPGSWPPRKITEYSGAPIVVDDTKAWRVEALPALNRAEHWRPFVEDSGER